MNNDIKDELGTAPSLANILKNARLKKEIEIEAMAREISIPAKFLQALESATFDLLPPKAYTRAYLRSIAHFLNLESPKILQQYENEVKEKSSPKVSRYSNASKSPKTSSIILKLATGIVGVGLILGFIVWTKETRSHGKAPLRRLVEPRKISNVISETDSLMKADTVALAKDSLKTQSMPIRAPLLIPKSGGIVIACIKDSTWIMAEHANFYWQKVLLENEIKIFREIKNYHFRIAHGQRIQLRVNNQIVALPSIFINDFNLEDLLQKQPSPVRPDHLNAHGLP